MTVPKPSGLEAWGGPRRRITAIRGDLVGVVERLDYLLDLGVNAIYFTPVFQSASNHRYHTHDYEKVDPMLGGDDACGRLIDASHARIRVVLDGVFNHASRGFFQFHDILENGSNSAYLDWFSVQSFPVPTTPTVLPATGRGGTSPPCKFNTETPAVREYLGGRPQVDRLRHRRLAARRGPRDRRRGLLAGSSAAGSARGNPERTSSARSGPRPGGGSGATCGTRS